MNHDPVTLSDAEIVELLWERSEKGLHSAEKKYGRFCHRIAMNLLGQREDAEECVNDVYLALWDTIPPNRPASLMAYIGKITRNISISRLRKRKAVRRDCAGLVLLDELAECLPDPSTSDPTDDIVLRDALEEFLQDLSEEDRFILLRRYYDGEDIGSVAASLNLRAGTVRVRLHRLRERLRNHLQERHISL
jgi:RNA polymerase sigma-70 factor (ECF subfamily)